MNLDLKQLKKAIDNLKGRKVRGGFVRKTYHLIGGLLAKPKFRSGSVVAPIRLPGVHNLQVRHDSNTGRTDEHSLVRLR